MRAAPRFIGAVAALIFIARGSEGCTNTLVFAQPNLEFARIYGVAYNMAFVDALTANTADPPTARPNYAGSGPVVQTEAGCAGRWWFRCCPDDGSYYPTAPCRGQQMPYRPTSGWLLPSGVVCTPCPSKPWNSVWDQPAGACAWRCTNGFTVAAEGGFCTCAERRRVDAIANQCLECAIDNGVAVSIGRHQFDCAFVCNAGFYSAAAPTTACIACPTPANARLLARTQGTSLARCAWTCNAGYTASAGACVECAFNRFRPDDGQRDNGCRGVLMLTDRQAWACPEGSYYVLDKAGPASADDVAWIACVRCGPSPPNTYYGRFMQHTARLDAPDQCFAVACPLPTAPGWFVQGCNGTSQGEQRRCPPISSGYFVQQTTTAIACPTQPCLQCPPGGFNVGCPNNGASPGTCSACPPPPSNGFYPDGSASCDFACNAGFFKNGALCAACPTSASCPILPVCPFSWFCLPSTVPYNATPWGISVPCPACWSYTTGSYRAPTCASAASACIECPFLAATPIASLAAYGVGACQWECGVGLYMPHPAATHCVACSTQGIACATGQYLLAPCLNASGATAPPVCDACLIPPNAVASGGPSPIVNNRTACPFTCNAGFFARAHACAPLTPTPPAHSDCAPASPTAPGRHWGGGNATRDNACLPCPPRDNSVWIAPGRNCTWTCAAGAYLLLLDARCATCPAGKFKRAESNATDCDPCPPNTYLPAGTSMQECFPVPRFATAPHPDAFVCNAGYSAQNDPIAGALCAPCFAHNHNLTAFVARHNMSSLVLAACALQSFACLPRFFRSTAHPNPQLGGILARCIACSPATAALEECALCAAGTFGPNPTACAPCPRGTHAPTPGATACAACAPGTVAPTPGTALCAVCAGDTPVEIDRIACAPPQWQQGGCPDGFFHTADAVCRPCPEGHFCTRSLLHPCPYGTPPAPPRASSVAQCVEEVVPSCIRRAPGTVLPCPPNTVNLNLRARSAAWCHPAMGFFGLRGAPALLCPRDAFCPPAATAPLPCATDTFAPPGTIGPCSTTMLPPCRPGWYLPAAACAPCPSGCFCPGGDAIFACDAAAAWWSPPRAASAANCTPNLALPTAQQCPPNTSPKSTAVILHRCRADAGYFYLPGSPAAAELCPAGHHCPAGALRPIPCPAPAPCTALGALQVTAPCPPGSPAPLPPCAPCAPPLVANAHFTATGACAFCCNAGFYLALGQCLPQPTTAAGCPADTYAPVYPACTVGLLPCVACPPPPAGALRSGAPRSAIAAAGLDTCLYECQPGHIPGAHVPGAPVLGGENATRFLVAAPCAPCPPGTVPAFSSIMMMPSCAPCPAGTHAPQPATPACLPCGQFAHSPPNATACTCLAAAIRVMGACVPCPAGAVAASATACSMCPAGTVHLV